MKRLEIKDAATQPAVYLLLSHFFWGLVFFLFTCPGRILRPLNSSPSPFIPLSRVDAEGLTSVKLNSMICCPVFHSGADSGVHLFIYSWLIY